MIENKAITGYNNEIEVVTQFNKDKAFIKNICPDDYENVFAIHVISKKYGEVNGIKIACKADFFLAKGNVPHDEIVKKNYYLNENDLKSYHLEPIIKSGVSVKLNKSKYTIFKMGPTIFEKLFKNNTLAAGASIYCTKDFEKNESVLKGWNVSMEDFKSYYSDIINDSENFLFDKEILNQIKKRSNQEIKNAIVSDNYLSDFIFKGIGNFEEPFTAHWLFENNEFKKNHEIPFQITTGSGRSKGIFTIVLKPI